MTKCIVVSIALVLSLVAAGLSVARNCGPQSSATGRGLAPLPGESSLVSSAERRGAPTNASVCADVPDALREATTATQSPNSLSVGRLLADLESTDGQVRIAATKEILRRAEVGDLKAFNDHKKLPRSLFATYFLSNPTRLDGVYSLTVKFGEDVSHLCRNDSFLLYVKKGVAKEEVEKIGKKYGFAVYPAMKNDAQGPQDTDRWDCVLNVIGVKQMQQTFRELFTKEPAVVCVGLYYAW